MVVLTAPEVLPLVTAHDVKMVIIVEVLVILGIAAQGVSTLDDLFPAIAAIVGGIGRSGIHIGALLTLGQVGAQGEMESQILKAMHLIIDVGITDEVTADGTVILQVKDGDRVGGSQTITGVRPAAVIQSVTVTQPLKVAAKVVIARVITPDGLGGIHPHGGIDGARVGITVLTPHELTVQVEAQVIVKE